MKIRQLQKLGVPRDMTRQAKELVARARGRGLGPADASARIKQILNEPDAHKQDEHFGELAKLLSQRRAALKKLTSGPAQRSEPAPFRQWGQDLDDEALRQMDNACRLPVSVRGALMPDAHVGYGLPVGGVLATENAVIPYAVGVDIACRMKLSVLDMPLKALDAQRDRLINAIETETRFGMGAHFGASPERGRGRRWGGGGGKRRQHAVLDLDWNISPATRGLKDKAHAQLGTSGSGNHFVEFGQLQVEDDNAAALGLPAGGSYLALLSHSGSRGPGSTVAAHYSRLAMNLNPQLPRELVHLAWLDLDSEEGRSYWAAMELMGVYASANHELIHLHIARHLGARVLMGIENHHNYAWREEHDGRTLIVHRKGATPSGPGVLGIIPGSMAAPAYVVRGRGSAASLNSSSHGAGRRMSRRQAKLTYRWAQIRDTLAKRGVHLISAGIDENPFVYKDIDTVMSQQQDLVEVLARFEPRLVKMAPEGERPED